MPSGGRSRSCSSSEEEDGDLEWKAAIDSIVNTSFSHSVKNGLTISQSTPNAEEDCGSRKRETSKVKLYQIKAQKMLDEILESTLEITTNPIHVFDHDPMTNEGGIRLFKNAPPGIVFDHIDELPRPRKRPRILPGEEIDEKSKKFRRQIQSVAVNGVDVMAKARELWQKSLDKFEAKVAAAKEAAKREEDRVAELKRTRGERWLPSIAREMQAKFNIRHGGMVGLIQFNYLLNISQSMC